MDNIKPLSDAEIARLEELKIIGRMRHDKLYIVRFMADGRCCKLGSGTFHEKNTSIMFQTFYWDWPLEAIGYIIAIRPELHADKQDARHIPMEAPLDYKL